MEMLNQQSRPAPGQLENCEVCNKRFTVTPYSKEGPDGGLLCAQCSKKLKDGEKKDNKPKQKAVPRKQRRQNQSNLLDGVAQIGAKSLVEYCILVCNSSTHSIQHPLLYVIKMHSDNIYLPRSTST
jgi:DNA repair protein RAD7